MSYVQTYTSHLAIQTAIMPAVAKGDRVLVTGANGFIAMWIVRSLLERGFSVRGTVRSLDKGTHVIEYFTSIGYGDKIDIVVVEDIAKVSLSFIP